MAAMEVTSDEPEYVCPLCLEEMDMTDRNFQPCKCGYQICLWCWHQLMEISSNSQPGGRCPACRTPYDKEKVISAAPKSIEYVTFVKEEDAYRCIQSIDGCMLDGKIVRGCFGTTKYCNSWIKNVPCTNPDCLYLHESGTQEDSYTKEEMLSKCGRYQMFSQLSHPPIQYSGPGLPPPVDPYPPQKSEPVLLQKKVPSQTQLNNMSVSPVKPTNLAPNSAWGNSLPLAASWGSKASNLKDESSMKASSGTGETLSSKLAIPSKAPLKYSGSSETLASKTTGFSLGGTSSGSNDSESSRTVCSRAEKAASKSLAHDIPPSTTRTSLVSNSSRAKWSALALSLKSSNTSEENGHTDVDTGGGHSRSKHPPKVSAENGRTSKNEPSNSVKLSSSTDRRYSRFDHFDEPDGDTMPSASDAFDFSDDAGNEDKLPKSSYSLASGASSLRNSEESSERGRINNSVQGSCLDKEDEEFLRSLLESEPSPESNLPAGPEEKEKMDLKQATSELLEDGHGFDSSEHSEKSNPSDSIPSRSISGSTEKVHSSASASSDASASKLVNLTVEHDDYNVEDENEVPQDSLESPESNSASKKVSMSEASTFPGISTSENDRIDDEPTSLEKHVPSVVACLPQSLDFCSTSIDDQPGPLPLLAGVRGTSDSIAPDVAKNEGTVDENKAFVKDPVDNLPYNHLSFSSLHSEARSTDASDWNAGFALDRKSNSGLIASERGLISSNAFDQKLVGSVSTKDSDEDVIQSILNLDLDLCSDMPFSDSHGIAKLLHLKGPAETGGPNSRKSSRFRFAQQESVLDSIRNISSDGSLDPSIYSQAYARMPPENLLSDFLSRPMNSNQPFDSSSNENWQSKIGNGMGSFNGSHPSLSDLSEFTMVGNRPVIKNIAKISAPPGFSAPGFSASSGISAQPGTSAALGVSTSSGFSSRSGISAPPGFSTPISVSSTTSAPPGFSSPAFSSSSIISAPSGIPVPPGFSAPQAKSISSIPSPQLVENSQLLPSNALVDSVEALNSSSKEKLPEPSEMELEFMDPAIMAVGRSSIPTANGMAESSPLPQSSVFGHLFRSSDPIPASNYFSRPQSQVQQLPLQYPSGAFVHQAHAATGAGENAVGIMERRTNVETSDNGYPLPPSHPLLFKSKFDLPNWTESSLTKLPGLDGRSGFEMPGGYQNYGAHPLQKFAQLSQQGFPISSSHESSVSASPSGRMTFANGASFSSLLGQGNRNLGLDFAQTLGDWHGSVHPHSNLPIKLFPNLASHNSGSSMHGFDPNVNSVLHGKSLNPSGQAGIRYRFPPSEVAAGFPYNAQYRN